jgi:hypothetical protein
MNKRTLISVLFYLVATYDGLLGTAFFAAPLSLFQWYEVTPPNHVGYVQFPALILIIFAVMFVQIALDPSRNRNLIPYGIMLKVAYSGIVFRYWFTTGIPDMWKPFAVIDAATAVLFVWIYVTLATDFDVENRSQ